MTAMTPAGDLDGADRNILAHREADRVDRVITAREEKEPDPRRLVASSQLGADRTVSTNSTGDRPTADVYWPDPSPLQTWWTEVMDGALTPRPLAAA